jgi:hypothetical protein
LYVDGQLVREQRPNSTIRHWGFTPDGRHLFWLADEYDTNPGENAGRYVVYLDGEAVARFDRTTTFDQLAINRVPRTQLGVGLVARQIVDLPPSLYVAADNTLAVVGPVGDAVKRFNVTPSPDTGVATALAAVQAAEAQARAAAEKKIADDKAAREKAEADRKAAHEKAVADQKAAYDKAMAERKAAYEKAAAERKAAQEKAAAERKAAQEKAAAERAAKTGK